MKIIQAPRQPHGPNEPRMHLALMHSNLDWFAQYPGREQVSDR